MFIRFVLKRTDDGIVGIFLLIIPKHQPGEIGASQIQNEQCAQQDSSPFGPASRQRTTQHQREQSQGKCEEKAKPADLTDTIRGDLTGDALIRKTNRFQIGDQTRLLHRINQPCQQTADKAYDTNGGPISVETTGFGPPRFKLDQR